ncbi:Gfo/Idh/MocA family protein [Desulfurivibrio alkaliphilus]|uniref:Oxidoreductase domain protein n=1 Tax=Desulfurivibrio alkaliphilus (strain DSM 19089 / UNIQEM U267 / AHT2) TaxID=589865 RepID=D6Z1U1_DESAT|nr:Gfo/Idh/MocA family oxidoreductase [Desulfurivibrio alkaliphilus]ADH85516.1 oxidoreductase domain protein [Desulfurivibrio alkaliphilus AHT 2]
MKKIRVGVIGVGHLGKFHAAKYAAMEEAELVGVADVNPELAQNVAAETGTTPYQDYRQLLPQVDAVSVVVPTVHHHRVAMDCLGQGIDVMVEKPMTTTLAEADELITQAAAGRRILQVGHIERYNPAVTALEQFLTRPLFIESHRIHVFKPRGLDVDVVLDLMIHDIDIILSIVDSPISSIHTVGVPVVTPSTDIANARIIFENGCTANITVSRVSKENVRRLRIFQPQCYISVDYAAKSLMLIRLKDQLNDQGLPQEEITHHKLPEQDALEEELRDFVSNVRHRTTPKVDGKQGRQALQVAQEIMVQIAENFRRYSDVLQRS